MSKLLGNAANNASLSFFSFKGKKLVEVGIGKVSEPKWSLWIILGFQGALELLEFSSGDT